MASRQRDLQLIGAAQRVEHYEVAAYGTAKAMAEKLGRAEVVELLGATLTEKEEADTTLTEVAKEATGDEEEEPAPTRRPANKVTRK